VTAPLLLDTCAVIWAANGAPMARDAADQITNAARRGATVHVSPISAWEVGLLVVRGRLTMVGRPEAWFERLLETPGLGLTAMPQTVLVRSSFLPGDPPNDPADRIIIATAREFAMRIVTRDPRLLAYSAEGHVMALAC
jgi:PIN domain nuclease of toxin-antitoxin system